MVYHTRFKKRCKDIKEKQYREKYTKIMRRMKETMKDTKEKIQLLRDDASYDLYKIRSELSGLMREYKDVKSYEDMVKCLDDTTNKHGQSDKLLFQHLERMRVDYPYSTARRTDTVMTTENLINFDLFRGIKVDDYYDWTIAWYRLPVNHNE